MYSSRLTRSGDPLGAWSGERDFASRLGCPPALVGPAWVGGNVSFPICPLGKPVSHSSVESINP